jgi:hypothetical protein
MPHARGVHASAQEYVGACGRGSAGERKPGRMLKETPSKLYE